MTVDDTLFIVTLVFVFGLLTLVAAKGFYELNDVVGNMTMFKEEQAGTAHAQDIINKGQTTIEAFDYLILLSFFLYLLVMLILAFLSPTNPVFFVISFLVVSIQLMVVTWFQNMFAFIFQVETLQVIVINYPFTQTLFNNMTIIFWVYSVLLLIIMFGGARRIVGVTGR